MKFNTWKEFFEEEKNKQYFKDLFDFVDKEYKEKTIFPKREDLFKAFDLCELNKTKVVIFGQDPYTGENQAMGLAFSVPSSEKLPPSLKNIYKEIIYEFKLNQDLPKSGDLTYLSKQGVLLLNVILSVEENKPLSHKGRGYEILTDEIVKMLNEREEPIAFMLWGDKAKHYEKLLNNKNHLVLTANHPSPLSANRGGWFGNGCFYKANFFLEKNGLEPIKWLDNESGVQMFLDLN